MISIRTTTMKLCMDQLTKFDHLLSLLAQHVTPSGQTKNIMTTYRIVSFSHLSHLLPPKRNYAPSFLPFALSPFLPPCLLQLTVHLFPFCGLPRTHVSVILRGSTFVVSL